MEAGHAMSATEAFSGGCMCGSLRYAARDRIDAGYCHCRMCQRSSGAPVLAWVSFPAQAFAYESGSPAVYRSSDHGQREFCPSCGTQVAFRDTLRKTNVDVNIGSLDHPDAVEPQYHIWIGSRVAWFDTADDLPRYPDDGPDAPPKQAPSSATQER
jgi:hypothetical protein